MADQLSTKPIAQWTREDAEVATKAGLPPSYPVARTMLEDHDYLQEGKLWVGQRAGSPALDAEQLRGIKQSFIPDPVLEEIRENRSNGLLQREAGVTFDPVEPAEDGTPEAEEQAARSKRMLRVLARWWDTKGYWPTVRRAFGRTAYSSRTSVRVWLPSGNLRRREPSVLERMLGRAPAPEIPKGLTLEDAFDRIEVSDPLPDAATLYTIPATQKKVAVYVDRTDPSKPIAEVWTVENGRTVLRVLGADQTQEVPLDLGGRLPLAEMRSPEIVTDPVILNQALLNFQNTVLGAVVADAGFPERTFGNAEPPGLWLSFPPTNDQALAEDTINGVPHWKHRVPWVFGFRRVTELQGVRLVTRDVQDRESESFATPSVTYKEPTSPEYVKLAKQETKNRLYHLCRQGHFANDSTAEASGVAYQQARAQFEADLLGLKGPLEGMVRDSLEAVLAFAALMSEEARGFLAEFRCVVDLHVTSGPVTPADADLAVKLRDARAISQVTMQGRVGVEDPVAEQEAIDADPLTRAEFWNKMAQTLSTLTGIAGAEMTAEGAGFLLGLSLDQLEVLRTGRPPAPKPGEGETAPQIKAVA